MVGMLVRIATWPARKAGHALLDLLLGAEEEFHHGYTPTRER